MGKVYDALRRAEEQRERLAGGPEEPAAPAGARPAARSVPEARPGARVPFWKRWLGRRRARKAEAADEVNKRRIALLQPRSYVAEQFRGLRARLDALEAQQPLRTLAVTSAIAGEGKTTAAINLALVSSMSVGRRVLLVDCDLRRPQVARALGLQVDGGLVEVLRDECALDEAVTKVEGANLEVLPVRSTAPNPAELLASERMREVLEELARSYDRVVLDVPCTLGLPDAKTMSELCDGIIFVVRADATGEDDVRAALDVLDRRRVVGMLLNGESQTPARYGYAE